MSRLAFTVLGTPAPQGSKRHVGKGVMVESSKTLRPWRDIVAWTAKDARGQHTYDGPVNLNLTFTLARPKTHFRTGKHHAELRNDAPTFHPKKPDVDKLVRAIMDALTTAGVWNDDSQVATLHARKVYGDTPGVEISVEDLSSYERRTP
jgi:crossover junction endodeoxyribonuclease RusA